jgi:hypothetical protein
VRTLLTTLILGFIVLAFYQYGQNQKQAKDLTALQGQIAKMDHDAAKESTLSAGSTPTI